MYLMDVAVAASTVYCLFMVSIYLVALKRHAMVRLLPPLIISISLAALGTYYLWAVVKGEQPGGTVGQLLAALLILAPLISSYPLLREIMRRGPGREVGPREG